jgi:hypothetical protein
MTEGNILITSLKAGTPYGRTKITEHTAVNLEYLKMGIMIRKSRKHHIFNLKKICKIFVGSRDSIYWLKKIRIYYESVNMEKQLSNTFSLPCGI